MWTLQIKYPQISDSGTYECQINTEPKMSLSYTFNVVGKYHASLLVFALFSFAITHHQRYFMFWSIWDIDVWCCMRKMHHQTWIDRKNRVKPTFLKYSRKLSSLVVDMNMQKSFFCVVCLIVLFWVYIRKKKYQYNRKVW